MTARAPAGVECFPALQALSGLRHGFTLRVPGLDLRTHRAAALGRLESSHTEARAALGLERMPLIYGEQVHGGDVAIVDSASMAPVPQVDGVITAAVHVCLGVYVADCCAVYLADPVRRVIGLVHSGKKGTEANIVGAAIAQMVAAFGCLPEGIIAQLSPCIRPPHYEIDFAARIVEQLRAAAVRQIHDANRCTACDLSRYYSYRAERGQTGRMLALLALEPSAK